MTVHQYRQQLLEEFGFIDESKVKEFAEDRVKEKLQIEIKYQEEVLDRMIKSGCKPCEKRRQQEYIKRLQDEQQND